MIEVWIRSKGDAESLNQHDAEAVFHELSSRNNARVSRIDVIYATGKTCIWIEFLGEPMQNTARFFGGMVEMSNITAIVEHMPKASP